MVVKDEHARILMTDEAASENGDDARQFLQRLKDHGLKVTAAFWIMRKLHRSHQSGLSSCPLSGRPFPYGQEYLGAPQKSTFHPI